MKYRTIVADPPWPLRWGGGGAWRVNGRGERHHNHRFKKSLGYPTMSVEQIAALPVASLADIDAHLFLWAPDRFILDGAAADVARAWGFEPRRLFVWEKSGYGLGTFPRPQHEAALVCRRGRPRFRVHNVGSVQRWKLVYEGGARKHSAKPEGFFDLIGRACNGPHLELFARTNRLGWDSWGDEALNHVNLSGVHHATSR